ncbi:mitochondrial ribosomal protein L50 [Oratosquilla oratoria]|uniref:mitochondrial ribosomal protein L50 n=1 Tax=Oratosquilla oratoria TaxID=337810 RepID=UPI003F7734AA
MAASIRNVRLLQTLRKTQVGTRLSSNLPKYSDEESLPADRRFDFDAASLAARGYCRNQKPYAPPSDVQQKVLKFCEKYLQSSEAGTTIHDQKIKYLLLNECGKAFSHAVPNSLMHKITSVEELLTFYMTPVETTVPLDMMKSIDLPKNLHIQYDYVRFHPETDTLFGGVSAYPKESTVVTGLKYKKKYKGYTAKTQWP